jgi:uncharacterized protein
MGRMRFVAVAALALTALPICGQSLPDTPANRLAAAQRYLKAVPPADMVGSTIDQVAQQVPEERREDFKRALAKVVSSERIEKITLDAVVKHFTVREIDALTAFYGSPEGKSITKKFGAYIADVMPALQEELGKAVDEIRFGVQ